MTTSNAKKPPSATVQEVCINLPGETVQCWRSSDKVRVVLRKHRDVIFDIGLQSEALYTVESKHAFYCPVLKKLLKKVDFLDGDRCHIWVSREFKDKLVLKMNGRVIGVYHVDQLDATTYGSDPKVKPEPLMIVMGLKNSSVPFRCTPDDPFGIGIAQPVAMSSVEPSLSILKGLGTKFDYTVPQHSPDVREYVAVTEASSVEIQPQILAQLESEVAVEGTAVQMFRPPNAGQNSLLYTALFTAAGHIAESEFWTANTFKEAAGYTLENFKKLDQLLMKVHIEKKPKGGYRVALKGYFVSNIVGKLRGTVQKLKPSHINVPVGSHRSGFVDGGYARTGKSGYGGFKRIVITSAENFGKGIKIQVVGTVIDLIVDVNTVYLDEKGSRDLSEFLGRAGVTLVKAGATAALGSALAAISASVLAALFGVGALPVFIVVGVVILGFILAAVVIDMVDDNYKLKSSAAEWAR